MIGVLEILALIVLLPVLVVDAVFLCEIAFGLAATPTSAAPGLPSSVALLIPAHNEEASLPAMLAGLADLKAAGARVLLVADNCTDRTAAVAREAGFEVVERNDPTRRGKGYALAFGRDHLALDPPEIVVVLDADCAIDRPALARISTRALSTARVVQAGYVFRPALQASAAVQISNFAFATKNIVRQRGIARLGGPAILTGSGMAFPCATFANLDLATGNVVEDLVMGIELIERGLPPVFEGRATVWSDSSGDSGTETQRARWEGGFLATARSVAPRLLGSGLAERRWAKIWMGAHLLVPPLTLLLLANVVVTLLAVVLALATAITLPAIIGGGLLACLLAAVAAAWAVEGRRHISGATLLRLPFYIIWKLALYARILAGKRTVAWVRTERIDRP
ncbi:glycosyltransferase family 2 protein [Sphingomonas sp. GB1N7]|uniref:glycosyltransferase family 2 protein n=1 Tax=Parasphingomonas caseinilytica TaxID=3096158 RepID=UPI002FC98FB0